MATPSEREITDDERGIRDRGAFEAEEADLRGTRDRAGVRSIIRSGPHRGRLVFDPARRWTPPPRVPTTTEGFATRRTGAGGRKSIDIEVPLLGHTEHEKKRKKSLPQSVEKEPKSSFCPGFSPRRDFKESTFQKVGELKKLIERESGGDQVLARAIAGSYAEEYDGRGAVDEAQDIVIAQHSERALKQSRSEVDLDELQRERPSKPEKLRNPFLNDIGPANIRLGTAVLLVEQNRLQFDGIDPHAPYRSIVRQLLTDPGSVKAAAAWIVRGKEYFREEGIGIIDKLPECEQEALLVSWFNEGPLFVKRFKDRVLDPQTVFDPNDHQSFVPGPNDGGQSYLQNRKRILRALEE